MSINSPRTESFCVVPVTQPHRTPGSKDPTDTSRLVRCLIMLLIIVCPAIAAAQTTTFTYQGKLLDGGIPANGIYDLEFRIFTASGGGVQLSSVLRDDVPVTDGIFTVLLDFGSPIFPGADRFIEIGMRPGASSGAFTTLLPRQQVSATPYAIKSLGSTTADGLSAACVNCITNAQISSVTASQITGILGTSNGGTGISTPGSAGNYLRSNGSSWAAAPLQASDLPAGNGSYIQNTAVQQPSSSFNISGNGTVAGTLSGGVVNAGGQYNIGGNRILSSPGVDNLFVGLSAGASNTTGNRNAFFGRSAGTTNSVGSNDSFFGTSAGATNTFGNDNSFFGQNAGTANTSGSDNTFVGSFAGNSNTTGSGNSFFGRSAGRLNTGINNSFFGFKAGDANLSNGANSFFGWSSGMSNTTGGANSFYGSEAGTANLGGSDNAFFGAVAGQSNTNGGENTFIGTGAGRNSTTGCCNSIVGRNAGLLNTTGASNVFLGYQAGNANTIGTSNTIVGSGADVGANNLTRATALGAGAVVSTSNTVVLGTPTDTVRVPGGVTVVGTLTVSTLGAPSATTVCRTGSNMIASCSSSKRYKDQILPFFSGIDLVNRLRPVTFKWKTSEERDLGLIAEEVAEVEPLLITRNPSGAIEGVKYTQLTVVLINAIKEQQNQIHRLQEEVNRLHELLRTSQTRD